MKENCLNEPSDCPGEEKKDRECVVFSKALMQVLYSGKKT
jgi:hypothetical protein